MNFELHNPAHLIFGAGTLSQLGEVVSSMVKKPLSSRAAEASSETEHLTGPETGTQ